jgi:hypothetical protein
MLETLTRETFERCTARRFRLRTEDGDLELELKHAADVGTRPASATRQAFSVTFDGPAEPILPQRIYTLENEELGELAIFLVPVASDEEGTQYEAVFT